MGVKAVILVGGASESTRFRPLSMDIPKPLFPIAGVPMIHHHIRALSKVAQEILLIGFFEQQAFHTLIDQAHNEFPHLNIK
jgi:mannose-1-phosphate guanylyltransferase